MQKRAMMDKEKWMELFQAVGMDDDGMGRWHQEFEIRYPDGHQAFLRWLQLPEHEISQIRQKFSSKNP